jgi:hypothetical protein
MSTAQRAPSSTVKIGTVYYDITLLAQYFQRPEFERQPLRTLNQQIIGHEDFIAILEAGHRHLPPRDLLDLQKKIAEQVDEGYTLAILPHAEGAATIWTPYFYHNYVDAARAFSLYCQDMAIVHPGEGECVLVRQPQTNDLTV